MLGGRIHHNYLLVTAVRLLSRGLLAGLFHKQLFSASTAAAVVVIVVSVSTEGRRRIFEVRFVSPGGGDAVVFAEEPLLLERELVAGDEELVTLVTPETLHVKDGRLGAHHVVGGRELPVAAVATRRRGRDERRLLARTGHWG